MLLITWSSMLSTGVSEQDTQHKKLVDLINQLNEAMYTGQDKEIQGAVLAQLIDYTVVHFGYEEALMSRYDDEDTARHKAEHSKFVQVVDDFQKQFDAGTVVVTSELMHFLRDWLTGHIMKTDKKMGQRLVQQGVS